MSNYGPPPASQLLLYSAEYSSENQSVRYVAYRYEGDGYKPKCLVSRPEKALGIEGGDLTSFILVSTFLHEIVFPYSQQSQY